MNSFPLCLAVRIHDEKKWKNWLPIILFIKIKKSQYEIRKEWRTWQHNAPLYQCHFFVSTCSSVEPQTQHSQQDASGVDLRVAFVRLNPLTKQSSTPQTKVCVERESWRIWVGWRRLCLSGGSDVQRVIRVMAVEAKPSSYSSSSLWPSLCLNFALPLSAMEVCVDGILSNNQSQSVSPLQAASFLLCL